KSAVGDVSTVTKADGRWQITAPLTAPADETLMTRIVTVISGLEITRVVDEKPTDLSQYGLASPQVEVTIKTTGATGTQHLLLGAKGSIGDTLYAQLSSGPRVILVASDIADIVSKSTFDLRDKAVLKFDRQKIDGLEIETGGHTIQLRRQDLEWDLLKPFHTHADLGVVSGLLTTLESLQMTSIVASQGPDSASYRLDTPISTVRLVTGSAKETLQIGANADQSHTYARNPSMPIVFTIPASVGDSLKNEPDHYRRKDVFEFQTIDATRLEVVRDGQTTVYEKATAPGADGKWHELSPNARNIEPAKIENTLSKLSYLRALTFVPRPASLTGGSGVMSVLVKYDEGKKSETVRLARLGSEPFAARADWPDAARLDANAYGLLIASLDDLRK
ncbi:MAG TPA: DUF4340 domain-containing protein, partial [Vicinamibacterales bacterium]|nr:DUF4340 domain-containing protein [Vicinamibacterales bacterium]